MTTAPIARLGRALGAAAAAGALACATLPSPHASAATPLTPDGWSAVVMGTTGKTSGRQLVMVSPIGAQYPVRTVGASWSVDQVSKDGRKVLMLGFGPGDVPVWAVVDRVKNTWTPVAGKPDLVTIDKLSSAAVLRWGESGTLLQRVAGGKVLASYRTTGGSWSQSPDGRTVIGDTGRSFAVFTYTGAKRRTMPMPSRTYDSCSLGHWDSNTSFTAVCFPRNAIGPGVIYRYSTAGGTPVRLTNSTVAASVAPRSLFDFWTTAKGQVVVAFVPRSDDPGRFGRVSNSRVSWIGPSPKCTTPEDVIGTSLYQSTAENCSFARVEWVSRYDLATGKTTILAGGTRNRGKEVFSWAIQNSRQG